MSFYVSYKCVVGHSCRTCTDALTYAALIAPKRLVLVTVQVSAFIPELHVRLLNSVKDGQQGRGVKRRTRPRGSSDSLRLLLDKLERSKPGADEFVTEMQSTTESKAEADSRISNAGKSTHFEFPLRGKKIQDLPPRMRFAPSPTGR